MATLILGNTDSEYFRASFGDRPFLDSEHAFDRNQVAVQLDLLIWPFRASFETTWMVDSLSSFRSELERAYKTLEGEARFLPDYDGSLDVTLSGDGIGHFAIKRVVCSNPATGPWFKFQLPTIDQTFLPEMISSISDLQEEYPIL